MSAPRLPRRPLPATLRPPTAWLLSLYLNVDRDGFTAWMNANRRHLPIEDQLALEDDLLDLGFVAGWYRNHAASDVRRPAVVVSDAGRPLGHDEITTREAADVLGVSTRQVLRWVAAGVLIGRRPNARATMVTRSSVDALRSTRAV